MTQASSAHADAPKATDQLTLADVRAAAARIAGAVVRTPMLRSQTLSDIAGADIWLKFENHQFTAAYKERGALNALLQLSDEQRARGVIAASAGNHSQGLLRTTAKADLARKASSTDLEPYAPICDPRCL